MNAFILQNYPFPIAFVYKEAVLEAPDEEHHVRGIIQTFTSGIHYAALICASEYARANYREAHLSWSLERLKRPLISDFFHFVATAIDSFQRRGITPLVSELETFAAQMAQTRVTVPYDSSSSCSSPKGITLILTVRTRFNLVCWVRTSSS